MPTLPNKVLSSLQIIDVTENLFPIKFIKSKEAEKFSYLETTVILQTQKGNHK